MDSIKNIKVLIVEDEFIIALELKKTLQLMDVSTINICSNENDAVAIGVSQDFNIILMDINLKDGGDGIDAARKILDKVKVPIIFLTAYGDDSTVERAIALSPYGYIIKPCTNTDIKIAVCSALSRFNLEKQALASEAKYIFAAEIVQLAAVTYNDDDNIINLRSPARLKESLGISDQMSIIHFSEIFQKKDRSKIINFIVNKKNFQRLVSVKNKKSNQLIWLDLNFKNETVEGVCYYFGSAQDRTKDVVHEKKVEISSFILDNISEGVLVFNQEKKLVSANKYFFNYFNFCQKDVINESVYSIFKFERLDDINKLNNVFNRSGSLELNVNKNNGDVIKCILNVTFFEQKIKDYIFLATLVDITHIKENEEKIISLAYSDDLTLCGNRRHLNDMLSTKHLNKEYFSIIFFDINSFKLINDTYGHDTGDQVIIEVSQRIKSHIRNTDYLFRVGGDEFVIISGSAKDQPYKIAEGILKLFDKKIITSFASFKISLSVGIAFSNHEKCSDVLRFADVAMYESKKRGGNNIVYFNHSLSFAISHRLFVEQGLKNAIIENSIQAYFQPIIDGDGNVSALESLCRWCCGDSGYISPQHFILVAEETQLIHALGNKMLKESCVALKAIKSSGFENIVVHFNVSVIQLNHESFVPTTLAIIDSLNIKYSDLVIEITESTLHSQMSRGKIGYLKNLGFSIAIDDFGSGYTSLSELQAIEYDYIKIDKSILPRSTQIKEDVIILNHVLSLCKSLNKKVIIEGIENKDQMRFAQKNLCDFQQGFLFSRALILNQAICFIEKNSNNNLYDFA